MVAPLEVDVTGWLISQLTAALPGVLVSDETPAKVETRLPMVRVIRTGGPDDGVILDIPTVVFHCYAADTAAANALAYRVSTAVRNLRGVRAAGAVLTYARKLGGPTWNAYGNPGVREAVLTHQLRIKTA